MLAVTSQIRAYEPPLTAIQTRLETNDFTVTVRYEVFDPERGSTKAGSRRYDGTSFRYWTVQELKTADGVVAWRAASAGSSTSYDAEVGFAVYDPGPGRWISAARLYDGNFLAYWETADLRVTNGIVAWNAPATGSGSRRDTAVGCAVYDAARQTWVQDEQLYEGTTYNYWVPAGLTVVDRVVAWKASTAGSLSGWDTEIRSAVYDAARRVWARDGWSYEGTSLDYWIPTNLVVSDRIVAWRADTAGLASPFDKEIGYAVYDPSRHVWVDAQRRYDGAANDPWAISGLAVSQENVQWAATNSAGGARETRGYNQTTGLWGRGSNMVWASFVSSTTQGPAPLRVWFCDMSLGAATWRWDFGDGTNSQVRSPYHVFYQSGEFTVTLTVSRPGLTNSATAQITVEPGAGPLRFEVPTLQVTGNQLRVWLTGMSESSALIVEASSNLVNWRPVWTNPPSPSPVEFVETLPAGRRARFYRAFQP